jgi:hypothetical protein
MGFNPCNCILKIQKSIWDSNSHNGSSLESVKVHSFTLLALPGACVVTLGLPSWPATLQPPCLGHKPKAKVATNIGIDVKKGDWYYFKNCRYVENLKLHSSHNCESVVAQVVTKIVGKNTKMII